MSNLKKNIAYNIAYQILSLIVPLITAPYISRVLGKDGMGLYSYTFSIAHYFVLFCMLGILNYGNREISLVSTNRSSLSEKFWQIYVNQALFGLVSLILYFAFLHFAVSEEKLIFQLQALYILSGILDISWFYFGIERFKITTSISAVNKILTTILIFTFVKNFTDVWIYTIILAGGTLFNNICYWLLLSNYIDKSKLNIAKSLRHHLKPLLILFIPVIAVNIYKYIDKIMLGAILDVSEVGVFEAAEKLINIPQCFIAAIGTVMLPRISNMLISNDAGNIIKYNNLSLKLVVFLSSGMAFGLAGISDVFVPLFYGESFSGASIVLLYLCPCILFVSWANVIRTQYLLPLKKDILFCVSVLIGAVVNIISNIISIPIYGARGAAISTLIAEIVVCLIQSIVSYKDMMLLKFLKMSSIYIVMGFVMYITITQINIQNPYINVILRIMLGMFLYCLLSIYFIRRIV